MRSRPVVPRLALRPSSIAILTLTLAGSSWLAGCRHTPADIREWKPDDHDRADETQKGRTAPAAVQAASRSAPQSSASPTATLVDVTWRTQCATCHGLSGRGDGPQGPMVHAPDLTRPEWLSATSDEQISHTIVTGKNRMPKFDFPPDVVSGLVKRIRASKAR